MQSESCKLFSLYFGLKQNKYLPGGDYRAIKIVMSVVVQNH